MGAVLVARQFGLLLLATLAASRSALGLLTAGMLAGAPNPLAGWLAWSALLATLFFKAVLEERRMRQSHPASKARYAVAVAGATDASNCS